MSIYKDDGTLDTGAPLGAPTRQDLLAADFLTDAHGVSDTEARSSAARLNNELYTAYVMSRMNPEDFMSDGERRAAAGRIVKLITGGTEDYSGRLWNGGQGFKTGGEYLASVKKALVEGIETARSPEFKRWQEASEAERDEIAAADQSIASMLGEGAAQVGNAFDFGDAEPLSPEEMAFARASDPDAFKAANSRASVMWGQFTDADRERVNKKIREFRSGTLQRARTREAYEHKLKRDNAMLFLPDMVLALRSEEARSLAGELCRSPSSLPANWDARLRRLSPDEINQLAAIRALTRERVEGDWWNAIGDMGISAWNGGRELLGGLGLQGWKLIGLTHNALSDEKWDVGGALARQHALMRATAPELIATDHGAAGEFFCGLASAVPFIAGMASPLRGATYMACAGEMMSSMDAKAHAEGIDTESWDYNVRNAVAGGAYAYMLKAVPKLLGETGNVAAEMELRTAYVNSLMKGFLSLKGLKHLTANTASGATMMALQSTIASINESLHLGGSATEAASRAFAESFVGSLPDMAAFAAHGLVSRHAAASGGYMKMFTKEGAETRSKGIADVVRRSFASRTGYESTAEVERLRNAELSVKVSEMRRRWAQDGDKGLAELGMKPDEVAAAREYFEAERRWMGAAEKLKDLDARLDEGMPTEEFDPYAFAERNEAALRFDAESAAYGNAEGRFAGVLEEQRRKNIDEAGVVRDLAAVRDIWARGHAVDAGKVKEDGTPAETDAGAAALVKAGFSPKDAAAMSAAFAAERRGVYSPAAAEALRSIYTRSTQGRVDVTAALAATFGGRLRNVEGRTYLDLPMPDGKTGTLLVERADMSGMFYGEAGSDPELARQIEHATGGAVKADDWIKMDDAARRRVVENRGRELGDYDPLFMEGDFQVADPADPSLRISAGDAETVLGVIRLDPTADPGAGYHEAMHGFLRFCRETGFFDEADLKWLTDTYGKPQNAREQLDEESAADGFRQYLAKRMAGSITEEPPAWRKLFGLVGRLRHMREGRAATERLAMNAEEALYDALVAGRYQHIRDLEFAAPAAPKAEAPKGEAEPAQTGAPLDKSAPTEEKSVQPQNPKTQGESAAVDESGATSEKLVQPTAPRVVSFEALTPTGGKKIKGHYEIVPLASLLHSNKPGYPMELQQRDRRANKGEEQTREDHIANFEAGYLLADPKTDSGAMVVARRPGPDGKPQLVVVSGNGRTMVLEELANRHLYDRYRNRLKEWAAENGVENAVADADNPVLVRVVDDLGGATLKELADLSNTNAIQQMNEEETARADADLVRSLDLAKLYRPNMDGSANMAAGASDEFFRAFVRATGDTSLLNSDGTFTEALRMRARRALLAIACGQGARGRDVVKKLVEDTDALGIDRQKDAAAAIAPHVAATESRPEYAIGPDVSRAFADYIDFRENRDTGKKWGTLENYLKQGDMLDPRSEIAEAVMRLLDDPKSAPVLAETVRLYADVAKGEADGLFGAARTRAEIWRDAAKAVDEKAAQERARNEAAFKPETRFSIRSEADGKKDEEKKNHLRPSGRYGVGSNTTGSVDGGSTSHTLTPESADPVKKFGDIISQDGVKSPAEFLTGLVHALGSTETNPDKTQYFDITHEDGKNLSLRVANHRATARQYTDHGNTADVKTSIVVKMSDKPFKPDRDVELTEHVYFSDRLTAEREAGIAHAVAEWIATGEWNGPAADQVNMSPRKRKPGSSAQGASPDVRTAFGRSRYSITVRGEKDGKEELIDIGPRQYIKKTNQPPNRSYGSDPGLPGATEEHLSRSAACRAIDSLSILPNLPPRVKAATDNFKQVADAIASGKPPKGFRNPVTAENLLGTLTAFGFTKQSPTSAYLVLPDVSIRIADHTGDADRFKKDSNWSIVLESRRFQKPFNAGKKNVVEFKIRRDYLKDSPKKLLALLQSMSEFAVNGEIHDTVGALDYKFSGSDEYVTDAIERLKDDARAREDMDAVARLNADLPAFKKNFFGDWENDPRNASKVVDEKGRPLVVWHGDMDPSFPVFDKGKIQRGTGFWFAKEEGEAASYALDAEPRAFYLNIRNPAREADLKGKLLDDYHANGGAGASWKAFIWDKHAAEFLRSRGYDGLEFEGKYIAFEPTQIKSATDNTGAFDPRNPDIRYSIAGRGGAERLGLKGAAEAEAMEKAGADREEIWRKTGWWRGRDGKWRVEIPDVKRKRWDGDPEERHFMGGGEDFYRYRLTELIEDGDFLKAYPKARDIVVEFHKNMPANVGGNFNEATLTIKMPQKFHLTTDWAKEGLGDGKSAELNEAGRKTIVHELQHAIQRFEGFAKGGSPTEPVRPYALDGETGHALSVFGEAVGLDPTNDRHLLNIANWAQKITSDYTKGDVPQRIVESFEAAAKEAGKTPQEFRDEIERLYDSHTETPLGQYIRLEGEVEARNVKERLNMTPEARAAIPPWKTEDVPEDRQIVRYSIVSLADRKVAILDRRDEIAKIDLNDKRSLHDYLVGKVGQELMDGFFVGDDLPDEYIHSRDAQGNKARIRKAKAKLATGLDEAAQSAAAPTTELAVHKQREGGKYYRRAFAFAVPSGFDGKFRAYTADMVSYMKDGTERLYDVVNIEDAPGISADLARSSFRWPSRIAPEGTSRIPAESGASTALTQQLTSQAQDLFGGGKRAVETVSARAPGEAPTLTAMADLSAETLSQLYERHLTGESATSAPEGTTDSIPHPSDEIKADPEAFARRSIAARLDSGFIDEKRNALVALVAERALRGGPRPDPIRTIARLGLEMRMGSVDAGRIIKEGEALAERLRGTIAEKAAKLGDAATAIAVIAREADIDRAISGGAEAGGRLLKAGEGKIKSILEREIDKVVRSFNAASLADVERDTGLDIAGELLANSPEKFDPKASAKRERGAGNGERATGDAATGAATGDAPPDAAPRSDLEIANRERVRKQAEKRVKELLDKAKERAAKRKAKEDERRARAEERRAKAEELEQEAAVDAATAGGDGGMGGGDGSVSGAGALDAGPELSTFADFKTPEEFAAFFRVWAEERYKKEHGVTMLGKHEAGRLFPEFYRQAVVKELQDLADKLLAPKGARAAVNRWIGDIKPGAAPDTIERASADIFSFINRNAIREKRSTLIEKFRNEIRSMFSGKVFDDLKQDSDRKVTGWVEEAARYIYRVCDLSHKVVNGDKSALDREHERLRAILDRREKVYDDEGKNPADAPKVDMETRRALAKLQLLDKYGAMRRLMPGEILDLHESAMSYLRDEARKLEDAWNAARTAEKEISGALIDGIVGPNDGDRYRPEKGPWGWVEKLFDSMNGLIRLRLQHLVRFADSKKQSAAKDAINRVMVMLGDGEVAFNRLVASDRQALFTAVQSIFTNPSTKKVDRAAMRKWLESLTEPVPVELSRQISTQGFANSMPRGNLIQLLVSLEQKSYAEAVAANGRSGQADLIRNFETIGADGRRERLLSREDILFVEWLRDFYARKREFLSPYTQRLTGLPVDSPDPLYCPVKIYRGDVARGLHVDDSAAWDPIGAVFSRRVQTNRDFDESASVLGMFFDRSAEAAKLVAWGERGAIIRSVFTNPAVQERIRRSFGGGELSKILKQLEQTFNGGESVKKTPGEIAAADKMMNWMTYLQLGFNPLSAMKQTTSFTVWANALPGGFRDLWRYMRDVDMATIRHLKESEEYKNRYGDQPASGGMDLATRMLNENPSDNPVAAFFKTSSMALLRKGDFLPGGWIAQGVFRDLLEKHMKEGMDPVAADKLAMTETFNMLEETQQSGRIYNTHELAREHGRLARMLVQFATSPLQQLQYETQALREWRDLSRFRPPTPDADFEKRYSAAKGRLLRAALINHILLPAALHAVTDIYRLAMGQDPEWEKDGWHTTLLRDIVLGQFSRVFFIGTLTSSTIDALSTGKVEFRNQQMLPIESSIGMAANAAKLVHDVGKGVFKGFSAKDFTEGFDAEKVRKDLERILRSTSVTRTPYDVIRRLTGNADVDTKKR